MKLPYTAPRFLLLVAAFILLFYEAELGLNLLLFELISLVMVFPHIREHRSGWPVIISMGWMLSAIAVAWHAAPWTIFVNIVIGLAWVGSLALPKARSLTSIWITSAYNVIGSLIAAKSWLQQLESTGGTTIRRVLRTLKFLLPIAVILLFVLMYSHANETFSTSVEVLWKWWPPLMDWLTENLDGPLVVTAIIGMFVGIYVLFSSTDATIQNHDEHAVDALQRVRQPRNSNHALNTGLRTAYRMGILLFGGLNLALLLLNVLEISQHWIAFEWHGQYLKHVVHEGTWTLILSLFVSMAVVLYVFRGNLNFYPNQLLKWLALAWIVQNAILCIGVVVRTAHYIEYFALASGRIALLFVLLWVMVALITLWHKVAERKTIFYLLRMNAASAMVIALISALPDWQVCMAKYNVGRANASFLHLNYLASFRAEALPFTDIPEDQLLEIYSHQVAIMPFLANDTNGYYLRPAAYRAQIDEQIQAYQRNTTGHGWRSWTWSRARLADYLKNR